MQRSPHKMESSPRKIKLLEDAKKLIGCKVTFLDYKNKTQTGWVLSVLEHVYSLMEHTYVPDEPAISILTNPDTENNTLYTYDSCVFTSKVLKTEPLDVATLLTSPLDKLRDLGMRLSKEIDKPPKPI